MSPTQSNICISYNMGAQDLHGMYTLVLKTLNIHIRQMTCAHVKTITITYIVQVDSSSTSQVIDVVNTSGTLKVDPNSLFLALSLNITTGSHDHKILILKL